MTGIEREDGGTFDNFFEEEFQKSLFPTFSIHVWSVVRKLPVIRSFYKIQNSFSSLKSETDSI